MNILNKMRITHKISALMIGLVGGFILIGITYYIQVNISKTARDSEKDAFIYQQKLTELKQLELNMRFQSSQTAFISVDAIESQLNGMQDAIKLKLEEIRALNSARQHTQEFSEFESTLTQYNTTMKEKITGISSLDEATLADTSNNFISALQELETTLTNSNAGLMLERFSALKQALERYIQTPSDEARQVVDESLLLFKQAPFESISLANPIEFRQDVESLSEQTISFVEQFYFLDTQLAQQQLTLETLTNELIGNAETLLATAVERAKDLNQSSQAAVTAMIFFVAMGTAIGIYLLYKSIVFPMAHMQSVIGRINRGKTKARVRVLTNDELGDLGTAFNKLFDERINQLESQSKENERLNNSIIALIQALGAIAKKDLTVKVPVSSDITGTISDAVNLLTSETAETLHKMKNISQEVNEASDVLQNQSKLVMQFAESERMQVIATSKALKILTSAMQEVAEQSEYADKSATDAIESTQNAKKAVIETVTGIRTIRETISETEKRTKRLGDRSQEISGIVNLINTIAERTHILALNASMHAASAGEAGKGFAVVAEEVQRLAENARQSTDEISAMVNNMRVETSDTVNIMNKLISQVADGSRQAEQAGKQMETTEAATKELVATVKKIAAQAVQQATVANRVKDRATIIRNFTDKTEKQLQEQKVYTDNLSRYAETLVERVSVFKLPQDESIPSNTTVTEAVNVSPIKSAV